ncbi:unnamed protein product [Rotaria socialis]|uniref:Uncharacterized protein n=1 Tax=Rotaria socialis TaxID=392032 RepID=A0A818I032_9BILA|nr:unnamed protein product [Rotaria socialis]
MVIKTEILELMILYRQQNIQRSNRNRNRNQIRGGRGERNRLNQPRNGSNQQRRSQSRQPPRQQRQPRRNGSRQIQLNDFIPAQLRDRSSSIANLPEEFEAFNSTTNVNNVPIDALPQRAIFARTTTADLTQPFNAVNVVNDDEIREQPIINSGRNQKRQTSTTTASFRQQ